MIRKKWLAASLALSLTCGSFLIASPQEIKVIDHRLDEIDSMMGQALEVLQIPGLAVGVVMDGKVVFTKGYGVRNHLERLAVTENTLFAIGSCSKAFTTFALGQLVDEGLIAWDDPVIKYLPEFRLQDLHATHHLTIRDLVTHRSGLPRHDFVWYNSKLSRQELLTRLQYLEPTYDIREKFQYNNLMYAVAGLVIEKVTGQTWEEYVQAHIFNPLGMTRSNFSVDESQQSADFASPHSEKGVIPFRSLSNVGPAGSINSSVENMMKWVQLQLAEENHLINKATLKDMHVVHMSIPTPPDQDSPYFVGYGLGWMIGFHKGHYTVTHDGSIDGFFSSVVLFPKEKLGVVVLANSDSHPIFPGAASYAIADLLMGAKDDQWLSKAVEKEKQLKEMFKQANDETPEAIPIRPLEKYTGEFEHPGYGTVQIALASGRLVAIHNDLTYLLQNKCYDHFTGSATYIEAPKFSCSFISNPSGDISEFHFQMHTEPSISPIVFKRKV